MVGSVIDSAARAEIVDLFARYCHRVDGDDGPGWAALFTADGRFEVVGAFALEGAAQLATMPATVTAHGGGKWRHQITNIAIDPGSEADEVLVRAYGLVTEWRDGGRPVSFTDYAVVMRRVADGWRIASLTATMA